MRTRINYLSNYRSIFLNGKTFRTKIDPTKPIITPLTPEIEDVAINSKCYANCSYCYTSATKNGVNFDNIISKAEEIWGSVKMNERPFQIAIGGAGESTLHYQWYGFVRKVNELGIVPNYTTNGMHINENILSYTEKYCGGVAVSYHPHIKNVFNKAINEYSKTNTLLNTHVIIGTPESLFDLKCIYEAYKDIIKYFVILPYQAVGRAVSIDTHEVWIQTFNWINTLPPERQKQFAFGALFYEWLLQNPISLKIDIYEPEIYSGYRIFDDSYKILRKSSYNLTPKK